MHRYSVLFGMAALLGTGCAPSASGPTMEADAPPPPLPPPPPAAKSVRVEGRWVGLSPSKPEDRFALAVRYAEGNEIPASRIDAAFWAGWALSGGYEPAGTWLEQRADSDPIARWYLGRARFRAATDEAEKRAGLELAVAAMSALNDEANHRPGPASYVLGHAASIGFPSEQSDELAFRHYQRGAKAGDAEAQAALAGAYLTGKGVAQSDALAAEAYALAARQKHPFAQFALGWMEESRRMGSFSSMTKAVDWYRKAAEAGLASAQVSLGRALFLGKGIPQDLEQAVGWYARAAEQGDGDALLELGDAHYTGLGASADPDKARQYWEQSADAGDEGGRHRFGEADELFACRKNSAVQLFSVPLACALRNELRVAAVRAGARPTRVDDGYWADSYDSRDLLPGTDQLLLFYTSSGRFATASYMSERAQITAARDILSLLVEKYGDYAAPNAGERHQASDAKTGDTVEMDRGSLWVTSDDGCAGNGTWNAPDGVKVDFTFSSLNCRHGGSVFLTYTDPESEALYQRESKDTKEKREEEHRLRHSEAL